MVKAKFLNSLQILCDICVVGNFILLASKVVLVSFYKVISVFFKVFEQILIAVGMGTRVRRLRVYY